MTTGEDRNKYRFKLKALRSLKAPVSKTQSKKTHAELRLLCQSVYQSLCCDCRHSWIPPQATWTSPSTAVHFHALVEYCLGRLERHNTSIFSVVIFVPAWWHAAEYRSNACWRPLSEDPRMQCQFVRKKQTVHLAVRNCDTL